MDITTIKNQRKELSMILNTLPVSPTANGRYTALAKTNLEEGRMWMGRILSLIGAINPYTGPGYHTVQADVTDKKVDFLTEDRDEYRLKTLRMLLDLHANYLVDCYGHVDKFQSSHHGVFNLKMAIRNAYTGIHQSKMWLGMEIGEVLKNKGGQ